MKAEKTISPAVAELSRPCRKDFKSTALYFIQEQNGPVKIGYARDPRERIKSMQVGNPRPLELVFWTRTPTEVEGRVHRLLADHRIMGEWYAPNADVWAVLEAVELIFGSAHIDECTRCSHKNRVRRAGRLDLAEHVTVAHTCGTWRRRSALHTAVLSATERGD